MAEHGAASFALFRCRRRGGQPHQRRRAAAAHGAALAEPADPRPGDWRSGSNCWSAAPAASSSRRRAAPFSIMPGWPCFRSKQQARRRDVRLSRRRPAFAIGFLTGHEVVWLPEALRILREEQPGDRDHAFKPIVARSRRRADARQGGCGVSPARDAGAGTSVQDADQGAAGGGAAGRASPGCAKGGQPARHRG